MGGVLPGSVGQIIRNVDVHFAFVREQLFTVGHRGNEIWDMFQDVVGNDLVEHPGLDAELAQACKYPLTPRDLCNVQYPVGVLFWLDVSVYTVTPPIFTASEI